MIANKIATGINITGLNPKEEKIIIPRTK